MTHKKNTLIVVSNRLPVSISSTKNEWVIRPSSGGLASALRGVKEQIPFKWIGWPGASFFPNQQKEITEALKEKDLIPIFLNKEQEEHYYHNVCNSYLWPLFHYFTEQITHSLDSWKFYEEVNELFAQKIAQEAPYGALVWIQDFHLMLLPKLLRELRPDLKIGFFLHIPFPSSEIYRMLPKRKDLLLGILGSDYIGFHTPDYAKHFSLSCMRILGLSVTKGELFYESRKIGIGSHPIGMHVQGFEEVLKKPEYYSYIQEIKDRFNTHQVILGVERLDYTKGISFKLQAFELFLEKNPDQVGKVILLQVIVPCRLDSPEYQAHRMEIEKLVSRINGRFSKPGFNPVHYMYRNLPIAELIALYCLANVCMVTSIRDGMNLVAQEYIYCASRAKTKGCLILSEFAGAVHHLSQALIVNPFDMEGMALAIEEALKMPDSKKEQALDKMKENVLALDSPLWAKKFLAQLEKKSAESSLKNASFFLKEDQKSKMIEKAKQATKQILILDYDGTLREITPQPMEAAPTKEILQLLQELASIPSLELHIVSGRDLNTLQAWLGDLPVHLCAEHGFFNKKQNESTWKAPKNLDLTWMPYVKKILNQIVEEVPGSFLETKSSTLCWHYRLADADYGPWKANELYINLVQELSNLPVEVTKGKCVLEVKAQGISKARYVKEITQNASEKDFILCMGDDLTDYDMYRALPKKAIRIHVGEDCKEADYLLPSPKKVREFLKKMAQSLFAPKAMETLDQ